MISHESWHSVTAKLRRSLIIDLDSYAEPCGVSGGSLVSVTGSPEGSGECHYYVTLQCGEIVFSHVAKESFQSWIDQF